MDRPYWLKRLVCKYLCSQSFVFSLDRLEFPRWRKWSSKTSAQTPTFRCSRFRLTLSIFIRRFSKTRWVHLWVVYLCALPVYHVFSTSKLYDACSLQFVSALGNTSFNVVFLGRTEGPVESSLFVHTSVGSFKYQVRNGIDSVFLFFNRKVCSVSDHPVVLFHLS